MGLQGVIQPDHVPMNRYELIIVGLPKIVFVKVEGIEEELEVVNMPDRSEVSGGNTKPITFTANSMLHHDVEKAALELWYNEGKGDVTATYKKPASLIYRKVGGEVASVLGFVEMFIKKRKYPDTNMANEGEGAQITWTFSAKLLI